jgi:hypothetical protein
MEVGHDPNWGCSAKEKNTTVLETTLKYSVEHYDLEYNVL